MNKYFVFVIAGLIILIDQLSKYLVLSKVYFAQNIIILDNILSITKIYNTGAAFNILENNTIFLIIFSILASILISLYILRNKTLYPAYTISWGLILGGTLGNLTDRLAYGYVIDFIRLDFINFPVFNISDISINIGAIVIILCSLSKIKKDLKNEQN